VAASPDAEKFIYTSIRLEASRIGWMS